MTRPNASIQLKALYSGGLIRFRREGMNVIYRAEADTRVEFAEELLRALENCCKQSVPLESVVRQVTAFTHERRVEIVRALKDRPLSFVQLKDRCNMTSSALSRHLLKLEARKVVRWDGAVYERSIPDGHLGKTLLNIVCSEPHNKQKAVT